MLGQPKRLTLTAALEKQAQGGDNAAPQQQQQQQQRGRENVSGSGRSGLLLAAPRLVAAAWKARRSLSSGGCVYAHAALTRAGSCCPGVSKVNQDAFLFLSRWGRSREAYWLSVMDGHGPAGHQVAAWVRQRLPQCVAEAWLHEKDVQAALSQGFEAAAQELKRSSLNLQFSGTTCVGCVLQGASLYVANVGDSRAILGKEDSSGGPHAPWKAVALTRDHKPELEDEKKRILAAGGRIAALQEDGEPCGPLRVWLQTEDVPGLAMSRSLGDTLAGSVGVTSVPEVSVFSLSPADKFLLLATDGVWEFISNQEAAAVIEPFIRKKNPQAACEALVSLAQQRWREEEGAADDATCLLLVLDCPEQQS
ncbi:hypothetical protein Efla_002324 [Eimeria flavescens]